MPSCIEPDQKLGHFHIPRKETDSLAGIVVNHGLPLSNQFKLSFLIKTIDEASDLPYVRNYPGLIQVFSNLLRCPPNDIKTL